jgi:dCTP deaminase
MSVLSDEELIKYAEIGSPLITPFYSGLIRKKDGNNVISYGLSSYGYDIRCTNQFKIFTPYTNEGYEVFGVVDPKNFDESNLKDVIGDVCIIPPNSFALAVSLEYFRIPKDVLGVCYGKSTYARCGVVANVTPLEPEWEGHLTIELSNTTPLPAKIYAHEGIAQIVFFKADNKCLISYKDRAGKYQGQTGITLPKC